MAQSYFRLVLEDEAYNTLSRLAEKHCGNLPRHMIWQIKRGVMSDLLHIIVHYALNDENCLDDIATPDETADDAAPDETSANAAPPGLNDIVDLARELPSGLDDPMAFSKLIVEREEFHAALSIGDALGALTEATDAVYYAAKYLHQVATDVSALMEYDVTIDDLIRMTCAKYELRARPGNPKDDSAERIAVLKALHNEPELT